ncbi:collagen alpha-1(I) chain-like [Microtus oregoni]|uniref:collagen alpha-1(I) chain-like n=1 Tax=Microtus oregoni TaxID=111838 RepID=UPI001BB132A3|nr:collagen alpha-1(I) chain-like [Microtus oregoni]
MEFTTRFGLHSQATRLREDPGPARRGPLPASHRPRAGPRSEGLGPPTSGAGEWVFRRGSRGGRGACVPRVRPARRRRRERRSGAPPAREGGDGGDDGNEAGNTCRQPVRRGGRSAARAEEKEGRRGGRRAPAPYLPPATPTHARARPARPGHRGLRRARPSRASTLFSAGLTPPAAPPRRARIGSRGTPRRPAGRRRSGRPRGAEGGGEGSGDGGRETRDRDRDARGRGASPAKPRGRVRREDAPRRSGGRTASRGGTGSREGTPASRKSPGTNALSREGGRPRPLPNDTRSHTETGATRPSRPPPLAPLLSPALRAPGGGGVVDEGGGRGCGGHGDRGPPSPRPAPKHTRESLPHVDPSRPARGGTTQGRTRPPPPASLDAWTSQSSPPGTATGTEEARGIGGGERRRGRLASGNGGAGGEEDRPEGRGRAGERGTHRGATAARPPPTTTPAHLTAAQSPLLPPPPERRRGNGEGLRLWPASETRKKNTKLGERVGTGKQRPTDTGLATDDAPANRARGDEPHGRPRGGSRTPTAAARLGNGHPPREERESVGAAGRRRLPTGPSAPPTPGTEEATPPGVFKPTRRDAVARYPDRGRGRKTRKGDRRRDDAPGRAPSHDTGSVRHARPGATARGRRDADAGRSPSPSGGRDAHHTPERKRNGRAGRERGDTPAGRCGAVRQAAGVDGGEREREESRRPP